MTSGEHRSDAELDLEVDAPTGAPTSAGPDAEGVEDLYRDGPPEDLKEISDKDLEVSELESLRQQRDEYLDALRRLQAEFDNYRKRMVRQQTELLGHAAESLIERLLPILDALDLAIAHGNGQEAQVAELHEALQQIGSLSRDTLAKEGLERIDVAGVPFDPTVHDAVAHLEREDGDPDHEVRVDEVLRSGYRLKGRVLRPAMVRVRS